MKIDKMPFFQWIITDIKLLSFRRLVESNFLSVKIGGEAIFCTINFSVKNVQPAV